MRKKIISVNFMLRTRPGYGSRRLEYSVADPDLDRMFWGLLDPDPLVRGSGSRSFYHHAKIVRKSLDTYRFFYFFMTFYLRKNERNAPSKIISRKTTNRHGSATLIESMRIRTQKICFHNEVILYPRNN